MYTSNHTIGKISRFLLMLAGGLAAVYVTLVICLAVMYVFALLHPSCAPTPGQRASYASVEFKTQDGFLLKGWWRPPKNGRVILLLAGSGGSRDAMLPDADLLAKHGYGSLTLEERNCAGGMVTLGDKETGDVGLMTDFVRAQAGVEKIGISGFSAGSAAAIRAMKANPELLGIVAEGHYSNLYHEFTNSDTPLLSVQWQINHLVALGYGLFTGTPASALSPIDSLASISPRPILLIFGEGEAENVQADDQFQAAREPKQIWIVAGTDHGGYLQAAPEEYERRVIGFWDDALR